MPFHDFEEIKKSVSLEQAAQKLGLTLRQSTNGSYRSPCPACESAGDRALTITPGRGYYCWGMKKGGDVIALVAHVRKITAKEAAEYLVGDRPTTVPESEAAKDNGTRTQHANSFAPLAYLEPENEAVEALGLSTEFAKKHGLGFSPKGVMRGSVAIPFRDERGTLICYFAVQELSYVPPIATPNVVQMIPKKTA